MNLFFYQKINQLTLIFGSKVNKLSENEKINLVILSNLNLNIKTPETNF